MEKIQNIRNRIEGYEYGRHNLIDGNFDFFNSENLVKIKNFYSGISNKGVCNEQHEKFMLDNPDLNLVRVLGGETQYFNDILSNHFYLLAFEEKLPADFFSLSEKEKKSFVSAENPYVIDVSFDVVERFKDSDYTLRKVLDKFPIDRDMEFVKADIPRVSPLGFYRDNLFYLGPRKDSLGIYAQKKGKNDVVYVGNFSETLALIDNSSDVAKIVGSLERKILE
jgi:hypothetical protein